MSRSDFSAAVAAISAEGGLDIVRALGISSDAELACFFCDAKEIIDVSAVPDLVVHVTHAWRVARIQMDVALQRPTKLARVEREPLVPAVGAGLRPKARCTPPASLMPRPFRTQYTGRSLRPHVAIPDQRNTSLQTIMELVIASASDNTQFDRAIWDNPTENFISCCLPRVSAMCRMRD